MTTAEVEPFEYDPHSVIRGYCCVLLRELAVSFGSGGAISDIIGKSMLIIG